MTPNQSSSVYVKGRDAQKAGFTFVDICVASVILFDPIMHEYIIEILYGSHEQSSSP